MKRTILFIVYYIVFHIERKINYFILFLFYFIGSVFKNLENLLVDMENFHSRKANSQGNTNIKDIIRNSSNSKEKDTNSVQKASEQDLSQVDGKSAPRRVHIQVNKVNFITHPVLVELLIELESIESIFGSFLPN
jgi:hypothetical protein